MVVLCLQVLLVAASSSLAGASWRHADATRRFHVEKPTPVPYDREDIQPFLSELTSKLKNMPMPDDPDYAFFPDENEQMVACRIPDDDEDNMEESVNVDDVMATVLRTFSDGKCARRAIGEWYYQVCGNLVVKRSPYTVSTSRGKRKVLSFQAYESLGVMGRDRKASSHLASANEPRYVQQTYSDGGKCVLEGQERRVQSVVTFECDRRFVHGYVHIFEVREENPCQFRLRLQSTDFCDSDWLKGVIHQTNFITCRLFFHPARLQQLLAFLDKYHTEYDEYRARFHRWMMSPEERARTAEWTSDPNAEKWLKRMARDATRRFGVIDAQWGMEAERERAAKIVDYVVSELAWISLDPSRPFTEEEKELRKREAVESALEDHRILAQLRGLLERERKRLMSEAEDEDLAFAYEIMSYSELLRDFVEGEDYEGDLSEYDSIHTVHYYASWLDYLGELAVEDGMVVRPVLLPPNRKFPMGAFMLVDGLVKSEYAEGFKRMARAKQAEEEEESVRPTMLFDGEELELGEEEMEEIARRFMEVYKSIKNSGDSQSLLFDLLDDEDFEY